MKNVTAIDGRGVVVAGKFDYTELPKHFIGTMLRGFADALPDPSTTSESIGVGDELRLLPE